jgi:hypothetical protein
LPAHAGLSEGFQQAAAVLLFNCSLVGQLLPDPFPESSSGINLLPCCGRLVYHSIPSLSPYASPNFCWVPAAPLGSWLVGMPQFSVFVALWHIPESVALRTFVPCHTPDSSEVRDQLFVPPMFSWAHSEFHTYLLCQC